MNFTQTGTIFDIERCSLHDGPGVRTTVFLKGCPLSCKWCHNPESQLPTPQLSFSADKCTLCGKCSSICPSVHRLSGTTHKVDYSKCTACGKCAHICPSKALKLIGRRVIVRDVMDVLRKDIVYFKETGGGLTVSGGEPFSQYPFLRELLLAAKTENIHTCVETCGFTSRQNLADIAEFTDLFLYDYKVTDPVLHKKYTGADPRLIRENFHFLYNGRHPILLRCPIIPGYNDTPEHFQAISRLEKEYPDLEGIEILPYHSLGREKALAVNKPYEVTAPTADEATKDSWRRQLKALGCGKALLNSF